MDSTGPPDIRIKKRRLALHSEVHVDVHTVPDNSTQWDDVKMTIAIDAVESILKKAKTDISATLKANATVKKTFSHSAVSNESFNTTLIECPGE